MGIELIPVVYWVSQDSEVGYTETLLELVRTLRPFATSILRRYAPPERSGLCPEALIYGGLMELRHKILDQYLPVVEPNRVRSVTCVWPWWDNTGIKVLASGYVETLRPLPAASGTTSSLEGRGWTYKFYRNDDIEERRRWVCHLIKEQARADERSLGDEVPLDENVAQAGGPIMKRGEFGSKSDVSDLVSITDPADWRDARAKGDSKTRKRCQRATERLRSAYKILELSLTQSFAKAYLHRLVEAEGRERQSILNEFFKRYMKNTADDEK
jgi:hypothetical protein